MKKKEELYSCSQQDHNAMAETDIKMVPIADLHDFEGHPFKVENDMALFELMQSIEKEGVIVPALARPRAEGGYELIAGHRRKAASKWAGLDVMPVVIRELDDNQAVIAMVDSNLQREHLKPSEKAFAYKMKLDAMKRQGARTDLTFCQVGEKLENPTLDIVIDGEAEIYNTAGNVFSADIEKEITVITCYLVDDYEPLCVSTEDLKKLLYEWNNIRRFKKSHSKLYDILLAELEAGNTIRETYRGRFSDSDETTFIFLNKTLKTKVRTDIPGITYMDVNFC